jgi:multicomponent Na+:H+ antiporter subunit G
MITAFFVLIFLLIGVAFNSLGTFALYRFPDVYTRLHGTTKCTTFGSLFVGFAVMFYGLANYLSSGDWRFMEYFIHTTAALGMLLITNSTGSHALARAAWRSDVRPNPCTCDALDARAAERKKQEERS